MTFTAEELRIRRDVLDAERERRRGLWENPETIEVGEGATARTALGGLNWPLTVVETRRGGKELVLQRDKSIVIKPAENYGEEPIFEYQPDPTRPLEVWTKRRDGSYIMKGQPMDRSANRVTVGYRRDYTDMSQ
ncbi:hypothetical protein SEA_ZOOMAN_321 [Microbacterium phage Zooman]|nr:hypothetical protein SEA_ZOOMAN_8 [Microbacterium phage Zooman]UDL16562.1 hypothetical protein SEA_ZOOMAN_321 [Microbacterium phage Zooman]